MYLHVVVKRPNVCVSYPCGREYTPATLAETIRKIVKDSKGAVEFIFTVTREE